MLPWFIGCNPDVPVDKQLQTESSGLFVDLIVIWVVNSLSAPSLWISFKVWCTQLELLPIVVGHNIATHSCGARRVVST